MSKDRRATIAAALDASEANDGQLPEGFTPPADDTGPGDGTDKPLVTNDADLKTGDDKTPIGDQPGDKAPIGDQPGDKPPTPTDPPKPGEDKAPQSWRAAQKAKWATLDPEIKTEVLRRERDHERVLSESASARQISGALAQVVQPHLARIQQLGVHPLVAVSELFRADHLLYTAPAAQRAAKMAELIDNYGIDINLLADAIDARNPNKEGAQPGGRPMNQELAQLVQEQLAPLREFVTSQQQVEQQRQQAEAGRMTASVEQMAADNIKYPFFDEVRNDMADIIELQAKKGLYLTPEQAYTRAIAMNPEVSQKVTAMKASEKQKQTALAAHSRAQRALAASKSVTGAPNGTPNGVDANPKDRRATIAAAFDALEGR